MYFFLRSVFAVIAALLFVIVFSASSSALAATYVVNSTGDGADSNTSDGLCDDGNGLCTLRAVIMQANATAGTDTINFSIGSGIQTITLLSDLPTITDPVFIDGSTQPGFAGTPIIVLDGNYNMDSALYLTAGNNTIKGLVIHRFTGSGIAIVSSGNRIAGNYIGTDVTGNIRMLNNVGLVMTDGANNNIVGGTTVGERNVISGNNSYGIMLGGSGNNSGNIIQGNFIGTNADGKAPLSNGTGIEILGICTNNIVGGATPGAGNLISGNNGDGIDIGGNLNTGNKIQGNYIGTDVTGNSAIPNGIDGIHTFAPTVQIGGTSLAARNVISGNSNSGINIIGAGTIVQGNYIGISADGRSAVPNGIGNFNGKGIIISSSNNIIGGVENGAGNTIAFNARNVGSEQAGIYIFGSVTGNAIRGNSIYSNNGPGIDLVGGNGVTPNDLNDSDSGPNNLQNFPIITSSTNNGGELTIQGTLNSTSNSSFAIDFYANSVCDPSGNGEGATYIGSTNVATNANGDASFIAVFQRLLAPGQVITSTATDSAGNTSEFSGCSTGSTTGSVQFSNLNYGISESAGSAAVITVTRTGGSVGAITVNYATSNGTASAGFDYTPSSGTLTFADGDTASKTFTIQINDDQLDEADETVNIALSASAAGDFLGNPAYAILSINDNDPRPRISINDISVNEESIGQTAALFTVSLSAISGQQVSVIYATVDGTATGGSDFMPVNGTLVFAPGEMSKNIAVPIIGDTLDEQNETFSVMLSNAVNVGFADNQGIATILDNDPDPGTSGEILISEFRTSGPAGTNDEFVELYNNTETSIDIRNYSLIFINDGGSTSNVSFATVPDSGAIFLPRHYLLLANLDGYSLNSYAAANFGLNGADFFPDNHGIVLLRNGSGAQVDAVGFTSDATGFREGGGLPVIAPFPSPTPEYSYVRKLTANGIQDTGDNVTDFTLVSTTGEMFSSVPTVLGAPGPENLASPIIDNNITISLVDPLTSRTSGANFVRNGSGNSGTLAIRRRFTNNTGATVTRMRFRVFDITTLNSPVINPPQADLRLTDSTDEMVSTTLGPITVKGTQLETPPAQALGGGLNTSATVALPAGGLVNGNSLDVQFLLNVVVNGRFRFFFTVEALP